MYQGPNNGSVNFFRPMCVPMFVSYVAPDTLQLRMGRASGSSPASLRTSRSHPGPIRVARWIHSTSEREYDYSRISSSSIGSYS